MAERICPQCSRTYGSDIIYCPTDGVRVVGDPSASLTGRVIEDRFTIKRLLAKGGMGSVYVALQHSMGREIALKMLRPEFSQSIDAVKRFMAEARVASRLTNPHTVSLYDFGRTSDGMLFIAMELLRGETLRALLEREGPLPEERVVRIAQQMCESLAEAHEAGLVHRDIKPDNVFLLSPGSAREFVKVLDFGVAKVIEPTGETPITKTGMVCGTPDYMSPETVTGLGVCPASDVYSMGVLLYQLLTGRTPFRSDSLVGVMVHHVQTPPKPVRSLMEGRPLSNGMEALVQRCLAKQAGDRPRDAAELQLELTRLQLERDEATVRRVARESVGLPPETTTAEQVLAVRGPDRRRALAVAAGVAALVALVAGLAMWPPDTAIEGAPSGEVIAAQDGADPGASAPGQGSVEPPAGDLGVGPALDGPLQAGSAGAAPRLPTDLAGPAGAAPAGSMQAAVPAGSMQAARPAGVVRPAAGSPTTPALGAAGAAATLPAPGAAGATLPNHNTAGAAATLPAPEAAGAASTLPAPGAAGAAVTLPAPKAAGAASTERAPRAAVPVKVASAAGTAPPSSVERATPTDVVVRSQPPGALVFVGGRSLGPAPVTVSVGKGGTRVKVHLDGYEPQSGRLQPDQPERTFRLKADTAAALEKAEMDGLK